MENGKCIWFFQYFNDILYIYLKFQWGLDVFLFFLVYLLKLLAECTPNKLSEPCTASATGTSTWVSSDFSPPNEVVRKKPDRLLKVPFKLEICLKIPRKVWRYTLPKKKTAGSPTNHHHPWCRKEVMIFQTNLQGIIIFHVNLHGCTTFFNYLLKTLEAKTGAAPTPPLLSQVQVSPGTNCSTWRCCTRFCSTICGTFEEQKASLENGGSKKTTFFCKKYLYVTHIYVL